MCVVDDLCEVTIDTKFYSRFELGNRKRAVQNANIFLCPSTPWVRKQHGRFGKTTRLHLFILYFIISTRYFHSLIFYRKKRRLICVLRGALGRLEGVTSIVNQSIDWQLLSA